MPLIYITGVSGSGKSTACGELVTRGLEAYDLENDGLVEWRNTETDQKVPFPHGIPDQELHDWYRSHVPHLDMTQIIGLRHKVDETEATIYVCGSAYGETKARHYFDIVIALSADLATIKARLARRQNNIYGKTAEELRYIEQWHTVAEVDYAKEDVMRIDATQPVNVVIETILKVHHPQKQTTRDEAG